METMIELRRRLQRGANTIAGISACATAIRNLVGVHTANVYFNHSLTVNLVIETMTILPRSCGMFVQGYSDFIADTYFKFMSVPCVGGTQSQDFITQSGQVITITYSLPSQITIYIKVRVRIPPTLIVPEGYEDTIKTLLLPASNSLLIGQDYTQKYLVAFLEAYNVPDIEIIGLSLSTDNITFSDTTDLLLNQIGVITLPNITVEEVI